MTQSSLRQRTTSSAGANQSSVRLHNERLLLSTIRHHVALTKVQLAELTGLTSQSMSVIIRDLERRGLLIRHAAKKGQIGQPSIPLAINPEGVFSLGLKIGRRSVELALMDFSGTLRTQMALSYRYPTPDCVVNFVEQHLPLILTSLSTSQRERVIGLGVAMPFQLWQWAEKMGASCSDIDAWQTVSIKRELEGICDLEITVDNDVTTACAAEFVFGGVGDRANFGYLYVGYFIGGGLVFNRTVCTGINGNAAAFGSMPMIDHQGNMTQLIDHASIAQLAQQLEDAGQDTSFLWQGQDNWQPHARWIDVWIDSAAPYLARAIAASCSVIDFECFILDGAFPVTVRTQLVTAVNIQLQQLSLPGIVLAQVESASLTDDPRLIGSASLPLFKHTLLAQSYQFHQE